MDPVVLKLLCGLQIKAGESRWVLPPQKSQVSPYRFLTMVAFASWFRKQISSNVYHTSQMTKTRRLLRSMRLQVLMVVPLMVQLWYKWITRESQKDSENTVDLKLARRLRESLIRWREWTSCLTFTKKHQENEKHVKGEKQRDKNNHQEKHPCV